MVLCLVGASLAYPLADEPRETYRPAPQYPPKNSYKEPEYNPQPYNFQYGVQDQYTGTAFNAAETQDAKGTVLGKR